MAIAAANMAYDGSAPSAGGQVIASRTGAGNDARRLVGNVTFTGDGSSKTAVLNYIDGTNQLAFGSTPGAAGSPSVLMACTTGGNDTSNAAGGPASVAAIVDNADNGKTATVQFATAPGSGKTVIVTVWLEK